MRTLLRIDASARRSGSHSRGLADHFQSLWKKAHPEGQILLRDLACEPLPHLSDDMIAAFRSAGCSPTEATALSDRLIAELKGADDLLISSPLYNMTLPSTLKAYFDHIVRVGMTIEARDGRHIGLLAGKTATLITARGGIDVAGVVGDMQTPYLVEMLSFLGISAVTSIRLEGTSMDEATRSSRLAEAMQQIDCLFRTSEGSNEVSAGLTPEDLHQIAALREGQAAAILAGDADRYAALCTEDILLMIPGRDVVRGREEFLAAERDVFRGAAFAEFRKAPLGIERSGEVVIEAGRQEVTMRKSASREGVYATRQKYLHLYRRTPAGWRYAVLMSNAIE